MMLYWELFTVFFKIGLFSFGGGLAMISIIQQEVVKIDLVEQKIAVSKIIEKNTRILVSDDKPAVAVELLMRV
jgi:hypothetical protein